MLDDYILHPIAEPDGYYNVHESTLIVKYDNDNHWQACNYDGCLAKESEEAHILSSTMDFNATQHWQSCTHEGCGFTTERSNHSWDSGTITKAATTTESGTIRFLCTECPASRIEIIPPSGSSGGDSGDGGYDGGYDGDYDDTPVLTPTPENSQTTPTPSPTPTTNDTSTVTLPNAEVPLVNVPLVEEALTELPEADIPLADEPEFERPLVELAEEDIPLADVPKTGDSALVWLAALLASALGFALLNGKKQENAK